MGWTNLDRWMHAHTTNCHCDTTTRSQQAGATINNSCSRFSCNPYLPKKGGFIIKNLKWLATYKRETHLRPQDQQSQFCAANLVTFLAFSQQN